MLVTPPRIVPVALVASAALLLPVTAARASGPALVIDADSGQILHAEQATAPWYPASVTKLMTAYVALREVAAGRIAMDTPLIVSARAAAAAPSKIGFKPGMEVTLENALRIIMVKSANDVSITIAEAIGGSVETFSAMMNREASRLGMIDSNFTNPNGLPDDDNRSSARDLALLGRALLREFPQYDDMWGIGAIKLGKRVMQNTNGLVGRYPGTIGMKTGFICASGFNVVAAAERNGRRLIVVVLGSRTAAERTIKAAELLDKGFTAQPWMASSIESLGPGVGTPPNLRPDVCGKRRGIPAEDDGEAPVAASIAPGPNSDDQRPQAVALATAGFGVSAVRGDGGRYSLAPRARFEPIVVYAGKKPGSTQLARGPVGDPIQTGVPAEATAFAPPPAAPAGTKLQPGPLLLQGAPPATAAGAARSRVGAVDAAKPLPKPQAKPLAPSAKPLEKPAAKPLVKPAAKPQPAAKPKAANAQPATQRPAETKPTPQKPAAAKPAAPKPPARPAAGAT